MGTNVSAARRNKTQRFIVLAAGMMVGAVEDNRVCVLGWRCRGRAAHQGLF